MAASRKRAKRPRSVGQKRAVVIGVIGVIVAMILFGITKYAALGELWVQGGQVELVEQAKSRVPLPTVPSPPSAKITIDGYDEEYTTVRTPRVVAAFPSIRIEFDEQRVLVARVPRQRIEAPTTAEIARWRLETARANEAYQKALDAEISKLERQRVKELRDAVESWVKIISGIISGIGGLVTILIAIRKERRETVTG